MASSLFAVAETDADAGAFELTGAGLVIGSALGLALSLMLALVQRAIGVNALL